MPWDLLDVYRDEDFASTAFPERFPESHQMTVDECIALAEISAEINRLEIGSEAWIKQQIAAGKSTDEVDC